MRLLFFLIILFGQSVQASMSAHDAPASRLVQHISKRLHQIWDEGKTEAYFPSYAWHNRYTYSPEKIPHYNETPWGTGLGKGFYDEDGDWHALYAFAFLDSHKNVEPVVGYAFLKVLPLTDQLRIGGGYGALITARPDILHNVPFPGVLPWVGLTYRHIAWCAAYIPGGTNVGNVLFLITKVTL